MLQGRRQAGRIADHLRGTAGGVVQGQSPRSCAIAERAGPLGAQGIFWLRSRQGMKSLLYYGAGPSVAGTALVVWSGNGIRALRLLEKSTLARELADFRRNGYELRED